VYKNKSNYCILLYLAFRDHRDLERGKLKRTLISIIAFISEADLGFPPSCVMSTNG